MREENAAKIWKEGATDVVGDAAAVEGHQPVSDKPGNKERNWNLAV